MVDDRRTNSKSQPISLSDNRQILMLWALTFGLVIFCYWDLWVWLVSIWLNDHEYSHGIFIPFLTAYLVWMQREKLRNLKVEPNWIIGGSFFFLSAFLLVVGRSGGVVQSEALSVVVIVPSLILLTLGWKFIQALFLPIIYFLFLIPWLDFLGPWMGNFVDQSNAPFQYISAELGSFLLGLAGYPVFHDGVYIQLPSVTLKVAQECSGLRYVTSIIAIGLPLVYFTQKTRLRAVCILSSAVVITILSNGFRIAMAGVMGSRYGTDMLHGPSHILHGWFVSFIGWGALFIINEIVRRIPSSEQLHLHEKWKISAGRKKGTLDLSKARLPMVLAFAFIFGLLAYLNFFARPQEVQIDPPLSQFPMIKEEWKGRNFDWIKGDAYFPGLDDAISRVYTSSAGHKVSLFIGYYGSQAQGRSLITQFGKQLHKRSTGFDTRDRFKANLAVINNQQQKMEIVFWYQLPGRKLRSRLETKMFSVFNAVIRRRNQGAVIVVGQGVDGNMEENDRYSNIHDFMAIFRDDFGRILS